MLAAHSRAPIRADVRLTELACYRVVIPSEGGTYAMSGGRRYDEYHSTIVKVTADDGTCGFGEASTLGSDYLEGFLGSTQATVRELAPVVLNCDPLHTVPLVRAMDRALLGHHPGKAAIDIAMWDLRARLLGLPVGALLGGIQQTSVDAFAAVRVASTDARIREAEHLSRLGYKRVQIKVGDDPVRDAEAVRAVVGALGPDVEYLCCDANRGWTTAQALRFVRAIDDVGTYVEQPCPSISELAQVRAHTSHPMIVDEAAKHPRDLLDALALRCVDGINIKPVRVGGLTKAALLRDIAQAAGLMIIVDEPMGGLLATASIVQLAATVEPDRLLAASFFGTYDDSAAPGAGPNFDAGRVSVPLGPGLGAGPDEDALGEPVFVIHPEDLDPSE